MIIHHSLSFSISFSKLDFSPPKVLGKYKDGSEVDERMIDEIENCYHFYLFVPMSVSYLHAERKQDKQSYFLNCHKQKFS